MKCSETSPDGCMVHWHVEKEYYTKETNKSRVDEAATQHPEMPRAGENKEGVKSSVLDSRFLVSIKISVHQCAYLFL